jgi:hypothetical protein
MLVNGILLDLSVSPRSHGIGLPGRFGTGGSWALDTGVLIRFHCERRNTKESLSLPDLSEATVFGEGLVHPDLLYRKSHF